MHPCHSSQHREGVRGIGHLVVYLSHQCIIYCITYRLCNKWHLRRYMWKRSVILTDRLGPDILLVLTMKRQVLRRERAHLKVPGCSWVLSALVTKKLPTFLSRLNEISGGCEKILPVSGSFWSNLKLLRMMLLTAWLWGWKVRVNGILSFLSFCDVCSDDCQSNCWARWWPALTTETG